MGQTALITGASKRVGRAIAEHLAANGWDLAIHFNQSKKEATLLAEKLRKLYPHSRVEIFEANLGNLTEVLPLVETVQEKFGDLYLLVNNASVFNKGTLKGTTPELFDKQLDVNLKAPFFLMRAFALHCKKGNIINLTDTRVTTNKFDYAAYSLSKKGLWDITKMAALELAPDIRVNAIAPGVTLPPEGKKVAYIEKLAEHIPMKKPGGVQPILQSIDFILSNSNLTGQLLFADGGENLGNYE
ncbi:MAG: short-chain dehydrogenase [Draconibacterium sp.]|nr:MAG: short-chain dehydrogenase [Draconibacterium sp.]